MREGTEKKLLKKGWLAALLIVAMVAMSLPVQAEAATASQREQVKQKIIDIFYSTDTSKYSVLKYNLTVDEFNAIYDEIENEHERMLGTYEFYTSLKYTKIGNRVSTIRLNTNDTYADAQERYKRVNQNADAILAGIEPEMDDLDKVLYLHDSIVELVTYSSGNIGDQRYTLGGALGDENAVCMGYAKALNLLLKEVGFETDYVRCDELGHGWSYVKLDGQWYHIDATWDDTRSSVKGQTSRKFLLRNENEFTKEGTNSHGSVLEHTEGSPVSTSKIYRKWFVHDIVGKMAFEDGVWYFVDPSTKDIARADADGNGYETVIPYTGEVLAVVDAEDELLVYTVGGEQKTKALYQVEETPEVPEIPEEPEVSEVPELPELTDPVDLELLAGLNALSAERLDELKEILDDLVAASLAGKIAWKTDWKVYDAIFREYGLNVDYVKSFVSRYGMDEEDTIVLIADILCDGNLFAYVTHK